MKAVLGVGIDQSATFAAELLEALDFRNQSVHLVHTIERFNEPGWDRLSDKSLGLIEKYLKMQEQEAKASIQKVKKCFIGDQIALSEEVLTSFSAANTLMEWASKLNADFIAVGSREKTPLEGIMIGSVTRKLVINSKQSLLIGKESTREKANYASGRGLNIVVATDHSEYCNKAIEKFVSLEPRGIASITIMTAYPKNMISALKSVMENIKFEVEGMIEEKLHTLNHKLAEKFKNMTPGLVPKVDSLVVSRPVHEAIASTMLEKKADLLVLGANGQSFLDRLIGVGSVSLRQAVSGKHNVLIMRN